MPAEPHSLPFPASGLHLLHDAEDVKHYPPHSCPDAGKHREEADACHSKRIPYPDQSDNNEVLKAASHNLPTALLSTRIPPPDKGTGPDDHSTDEDYLSQM